MDHIHATWYWIWKEFYCMYGPWKAACLHFSIKTPSSIRMSFGTTCNLFQEQVRIKVSTYFLAFLGAFAELREATVSFITCVCRSVLSSIRLSYVRSHGTAMVAQLVESLRYKSKVTGSIVHGVNGIFHLHNPSGRTMILGSNQPLTEMSRGKVLGG
jgi:hypothetical protein